MVSGKDIIMLELFRAPHTPPPFFFFFNKKKY